MQLCTPTESRTAGSIKENLSRRVNVFLKFNSEFKRRFTENMSYTQACFFPDVLFTFAPILGICIRQDNRNHAAVRLGNNEVPALYIRIFFNSLLSASFMYVSGVSLCDISDSAYW